MDEPLDVDEAAWLERHLAECADCQAAAVAYDENRAMLRGLPMPEPPRDLRARTMAAIAAEEAHLGHGARRGAGATARRLAPYGALGSVLIVVLVVGATAFAPVTNVLDTGSLATPRIATSSLVPSGAPPPASPLPPDATPTPPAATPIAVADAAPVSWAHPADDGSYSVAVAPVGEVCAPEAAPDCAQIDAAASAVVTIDETPAAVVGSPVGGQIVVAGAGTRGGGGSIFALALPTSAPATSPSPGPSPEPGPSASAEPSSPSSSEPTTPATSASPDPSASEPPQPSASPTIEPSPSAQARRLAILDDIVLVGETAAYSPSGAWFAFTARPPDDSLGPDVYIWRADWPSARPLTNDHRTVFASWLGETILASRPAPAPAPEQSPAGSSATEPQASAAGAAETVSIDPETGTEQPLAGASVWRPTVDPNGRFVVYWDGTIEADPAGIAWRPSDGRLVIARFDSAADSVIADPVTIVEGPLSDWDARWDEHGGRLALWVADPEMSGIGELSAFAVDPSTGIDPDAPILSDVLALSGFTIGHGRLAWATPPGQGGEGSRLEVLAWVGPDAGMVTGAPSPGDAPVVVVR
jgi:hypothetical protein